jgi:hypothetical protein
MKTQTLKHAEPKTTDSKGKHKIRKSLLRHWPWVAGALAVLIVIRVCLPYAVESYVNRQLNKAKDYGGRINHVDIQLYRGQYRIHAVEIYKRSGQDHVPFFAAKRVDLSVEWRELFHGTIVGQIKLHQPQLNFIAGPPAENTVTNKDEGWEKILSSLFPFDLNRVEITQGEIHFKNAHSTPPVDISMNSLNAVATNLTNARDIKQQLPAGLTAKGTTIGGGGLDLQVQFNPLASAPTYQITCSLTNVDVTSLNDFLKAYGKFDVEKGQFAMFTSVAAKEGNYDGYVKVFFNGLDVFAWDKERQKNALEIFWQAIVGTLTTAFKNQHTDTLATKIPISGSYSKGSVGIWSAITTLLRNAFVRALVPQLDQPVTVNQVEQKKQKKQEIHQEAISPSAENKGAQDLVKPK